ncbi:uncharacterized protein LOC106086739 [Stomoxys calcitrans]|uniref:uncharacterized protein LOC106086739 n=1 Tax=Stomoxys calcitrans TaxID=35570 RepID=UPI0027E23DFC|nr:uncharacterized protein LOC106086739 [Stomoxys calcitrans]
MCDRKISLAKLEERRLCVEFLELYKTMPSLWDMSSEEYHDKELKKINYERLLQKFRQMEPMASMKEMKRKINVLRTNYRREVKRLENCPIEERSQLFYFEAMDFLRHSDRFQQQQPRQKMKICRIDQDPTYLEDETEIKTHKRMKMCRIEQDPTYLEEETEIKPDFTEQHEYDDTMEEEPLDFETKDTSADFERNNLYKQSHVDFQSNDLYKEQSVDMNRSDLNKEPDEIDRLGQLWVAKIRKMNGTQKLWAEKFINEILLEGQLGNLHRHSIQIMESSPNSTSYSDRS